MGSRGRMSWLALAHMSLFLEYNAGREIIRTEKRCNSFLKGGEGGEQGFEAADASSEKAFVK